MLLYYYTLLQHRYPTLLHYCATFTTLNTQQRVAAANSLDITDWIKQRA